MTREEAIFCEKSYIGETNCIDCKYYGTDTCKSRESHKMAIEALKHEPCEDAISREGLKKWLDLNFAFGGADRKFEMFERIDNELPSVTPTQKTGQWIEEPSDNYPYLKEYRCSECGRSVGLDSDMDVCKEFPYCHCGAKMEGE